MGPVLGRAIRIVISQYKVKDKVGTYKTSDFRKGLKVQIDGEPYLMVEMNFVKRAKATPSTNAS